MFDVLLLHSVTAPLQASYIADRNGQLSRPTQERVKWVLQTCGLHSALAHHIPLRTVLPDVSGPPKESLLLKCPDYADIKSLLETVTNTEPVRNRLGYLTKVHSDTNIQNASYSCFLARNAFFLPRNGVSDWACPTKATSLRSGSSLDDSD